MFNGPGKYDELCTQAREAAGALGAILIIIEGDQGNGFEVHASPRVMADLPGGLREMADIIEAQVNAAAFVCPHCQRTSYLPEDKANGYCGSCHEFTGVAP